MLVQIKCDGITLNLSGFVIDLYAGYNGRQTHLYLIRFVLALVHPPVIPDLVIGRGNVDDRCPVADNGNINNS